MIIENGRAVVIQYELKLNNGEVVDSAGADDPLTFVFGKGHMLAAFEENLSGKKKGDDCKFSLSPENGYGPRDEDAVMPMPRNMFPSHVAEGMIFEAETPDGQQALLRVVKISPEEVTVDANHPMAGETLNFSVTIIDVREPRPDDEDDHGHDHDHEHGPGCSH